MKTCPPINLQRQIKAETLHQQALIEKPNYWKFFHSLEVMLLHFTTQRKDTEALIALPLEAFNIFYCSISDQQMIHFLLTIDVRLDALIILRTTH